MSRREGALLRWGERALCFVSGAAAGFAHPPYGVLPALLGFALALWLLERRDTARPLRSGFLRGWLIGAGYLAVCTSWIGEPFFIDPSRIWQAPFAMALTPGLIGLLWGAAGWMYAVVAPRGPWARVLTFASFFAAWEWLRGHMLTGFPWDLPGEAWRAGSAPSQAAAFVGAYGLGWITLAIAAAPATLAWRARPMARFGPPVLAAAAVAALYVGGAARLAAHPAATATGPSVRIVQPDLPEPPTVDDALVEATLRRYIALSRAPGPTPQVVIWPEGAIPSAFNSYLADDSPMRAELEAALAPNQLLLLGGYRVEPDPAGWRYFNTLLALVRGPAGLARVATYDKHHLVPFGEYLPLSPVLTPLGLSQVVSVGQGFTAGPKPRPVTLPLAEPWARVQPLICYEALFPSLAEDAARAGWIVNISDDAWFGRHQGPWQHLNLASYRAIEEGLPMVRATPTGVSAVIDALGRTVRAPDGALQRLAPSRAGVIDARLPAPLAPTPFTRWRDVPFWVMVTLGLAVGAASRMRGASAWRDGAG
ncbi:MAG: apolipoprotein N-acyltransferase [Caulobacteraceae bacterium]|nr:apolipoprotein N-acyltransferase [Caulobacter sp.]